MVIKRNGTNTNFMNNFKVLEKNLIDLSLASTPTNALSELSRILEENNLEGREIKIVLGDLPLLSEHLHKIKTILESSGIKLEVVCAKSLNTQLAALGAGLIVSENMPNEEIFLQEITDNNSNINELNIDKLESIMDLEGTTLQEITEQYQTEKTLEEILEYEESEEEITIDKQQDYKTKTLYLKQTLRSGQSVNFEGNIVIIGDCHSGSEINAAGDITVWGILNGIAHAGVRGNSDACIRALKINAIQLRIANLFARKPDKLDFEKIEKTSSFIPEEAKISNGEIKIYSLNG